MTKKGSIGEGWATRFANLLEKGAGQSVAGTAGQSALIADPQEVLTPAEMTKADELTIAGSKPGIQLMEAAGIAIADSVRSRLRAGARIAVMTGPGNNGGDGFVAA